MPENPPPRTVTRNAPCVSPFASTKKPRKIARMRSSLNTGPASWMSANTLAKPHLTTAARAPHWRRSEAFEFVPVAHTCFITNQMADHHQISKPCVLRHVGASFRWFELFITLQLLLPHHELRLDTAPAAVVSVGPASVQMCHVSSFPNLRCFPMPVTLCNVSGTLASPVGRENAELLDPQCEPCAVHMATTSCLIILKTAQSQNKQRRSLFSLFMCESSRIPSTTEAVRTRTYVSEWERNNI